MKSFLLTTLTFLAIAGTSVAGGGVVVRQRAFVPAADVVVDTYAVAPAAVVVAPAASFSTFRVRSFAPAPVLATGFSGGAFVERTEVRRGLFGRVRSRSTFRAFVP